MSTNNAASVEVGSPKRRKSLAGRIVPLLLLAIVLGVGGTLGYGWWTNGRFHISTDDAYVGADTSTLSAKISGYIVSVDAAENQWVRKGDVIARVDDGDYRLAVRAAEDKIATQQATIARFKSEMDAAEATIDEAVAKVKSVAAELERAKLEFTRQAALVAKNHASRQALDNARADRDGSIADLAAAKATVASARAQLAVLEAQRNEEEHVLDELLTALDQAKRDLSFTVIYAPFDGIVGNRAVEVGQLVQPGTRIAAVVPIKQVYVDANFKETDLKSVKIGQEAEVEVDAYPDRKFRGVVDSVSPASGSVFSLLPPENATGNFTKIVQRLPVRVRFERLGDDVVLRPGMSVVVTVDSRDKPAGGGIAARAADSKLATGN